MNGQTFGNKATDQQRRQINALLQQHQQLRLLQTLNQSATSEDHPSTGANVLFPGMQLQDMGLSSNNGLRTFSGQKRSGSALSNENGKNSMTGGTLVSSMDVDRSTVEDNLARQEVTQHTCEEDQEQADRQNRLHKLIYQQLCQTKANNQVKDERDSSSSSSIVRSTVKDDDKNAKDTRRAASRFDEIPQAALGNQALLAALNNPTSSLMSTNQAPIMSLNSSSSDLTLGGLTNLLSGNNNGILRGLGGGLCGGVSPSSSGISSSSSVLLDAIAPMNNVLNQPPPLLSSSQAIMDLLPANLNAATLATTLLNGGGGNQNTSIIDTSTSSTSNSVTKTDNEKKKKGKKNDELKKPKRPLSAYNLFFKYERARILESIEQGENKNGESSESSATKDYDPEQIQRSAAKSLGSVLDPNASDSQIQDFLNAYSMTKVKKAQKKKPHGKISFENLAKTIGERWSKLSEKDRDVYKKMADEDMIRYKKENELYLKHSRRRTPKLNLDSPPQSSHQQAQNLNIEGLNDQITTENGMQLLMSLQQQQQQQLQQFQMVQQLSFRNYLDRIQVEQLQMTQQQQQQQLQQLLLRQTGSGDDKSDAESSDHIAKRFKSER